MNFNINFLKICYNRVSILANGININLQNINLKSNKKKGKVK